MMEAKGAYKAQVNFALLMGENFYLTGFVGETVLVFSLSKPSKCRSFVFRIRFRGNS
jgi:hypothetical protein